MATLELVEKLRKYANVSYQEASDALDASKDDILDAILYLEQRGRIQRPEEPVGNSAHYSTEQATDPQKNFQTAPPKEESFGDMMSRFGKWLSRVFQKTLVNHFTVSRHEKVSFSVPILILILCLLFSFGSVFILMIVGLFFGFSYSFEGDDLKKNNSVNHVMDSVSRATDDIKKSVQVSYQSSEKHDSDSENGHHSTNTSDVSTNENKNHSVNWSDDDSTNKE